MTSNSENTKLLLFLSQDNCKDGCVAQRAFEDEAKKMDLIWTSQARCLTSSETANSSESGSPSDIVCAVLTQSDLQRSDLVILLQKDSAPSAGNSGSASSIEFSLKSKFPGWSGKFETWEFSGGGIEETSVRQHIGKLLVRLILQGGKRQSSSGQSVSSNPNLHISGGAGSASKESNSVDAKTSKDAVRVSRESKGRGGKTVTVVSGLSLDDAKLQDLAKRLKQVCGTGGTIKEGKIEIQGDQCDRVMAELQNKGFKPKRSGG